MSTEPESYPVLQRVLSLRPEGTAVEFGVGVGDSLRLIAAQMPAVGFDSFEGLPEDWRPGYLKGDMAFAPPEVAGARLVAGWFDDTLPDFDFAELGLIGLVHLDADLYSSTATALKWVGPHLKSGCFIVFDEWFAHGYPDHVAAQHEQRAWREYVAAHEVRFDVVGRSDQEFALCLI